MKVRTRIAPSPTGIAHVGNMYTALINYVFSKNNKGKFVLRIEDTDRDRYVPGAETIIYKSLQWLGIKYDEGPDIGGKYAPYTQSKRLELYRKFAEELVHNQFAYYCFCSSERLSAMRKAQQKAGKLSMYDGKCKHIDKKIAQDRSKKEKHVIRFNIPKSGNTSWNDVIRGEISFENITIDDQIILKSDGYPTYHLAVVVDDHLMKISHVIRAEEWISSTPKHILIYKAFGWKLPIYAHTPLLRNPDRSKLSKRRNPVSVSWYKEHGYLPKALVNYLALLGWSHPEEKEIFSLKEYVSKFSLKRIKTTQPIFDIEKLTWMNGRYIRNMNNGELYNELTDFLPKESKKMIVMKIIPLVKERIHTLSEFKEYSEFFFTAPKPTAENLLKQSKHNANETKRLIIKANELLKSVKNESFKTIELESKTRSLISNNWSTRKVFMTLRVAITGKEISPPLFESLEILGKKESMKRLKHAATTLQE